MKLSDKKDIEVYNDTNDKLLHTFSEKEMMKWLIKNRRTNIKEYKADGVGFRDLLLYAGRRGSKSVISVIISAYELYKLLMKKNPQGYYRFPKGQEIYASFISSSEEQSRCVMDRF